MIGFRKDEASSIFFPLLPLCRYSHLLDLAHWEGSFHDIVVILFSVDSFPLVN